MTTAPFGEQLRSWRTHAHLSQLALAVAAGTTPRHLSFLETGRSHPSRAMVGRLGDALGLTLRARNTLLDSAGYAPVYDETPLDADDMAPFRAVVDLMLVQHDPFPAFAVDRRWQIVQANAAAEALLAGGTERNAARLIYDAGWRGIENWPAVAWYGVRRLEADVARHPRDDVLRGLLDHARAAVADVPRPPGEPGQRVVCPNFLLGGQVVRTLSVVAQFGSAQDVTLDELRVELIHPADDAAREFFLAAAAAAAAGRGPAAPAPVPAFA